MTPPAGPRPPRLLKLQDGEVVWAGRKDDDAPPVAQAREAARVEAEDEYRRLLYVAMTRAADRLIVCGADGERARPKGCWYDLIVEPLRPLFVEEETAEGKVLRYYKTTPAMPDLSVVADVNSAPAATAVALPSWLRQPVPPEPARPLLLSPSAAFEEEIERLAPSGASPAARRQGLLRGRIVHRLMQSLPDIPAARRKDAAERYLKTMAADLPAADQALIVREVLTILNDLIFAEVFAPGSRAEVPIIGRLPRAGAAPVVVAGQVDRLALTPEAVLIADYKTDRAVPASVAQAPEPYVAQLALYRAALSRLYPDRTIRAALVFTARPTMLELTTAAMDAALAKVLAAATAAGPTKLNGKETGDRADCAAATNQSRSGEVPLTP